MTLPRRIGFLGFDERGIGHVSRYAARVLWCQVGAQVAINKHAPMLYFNNESTSYICDSINMCHKVVTFHTTIQFPLVGTF